MSSVPPAGSSLSQRWCWSGRSRRWCRPRRQWRSRRSPQPRRWHRVDLRDDRGQLAGVEALPFGLLIFVAGSLLAASAWAVVDVKLAVEAAAREAARAYVEAPDASSAPEAARRRARETIAGHGRDADRVAVEVDHPDGRPWARCVRVVVTATYPVPAITVPWVGGWGDGLDVTSSHSEVIDPYRAGLAGEAAC